MATGEVVCWRCGRPIVAGTRWALGHDDNDTGVVRGPEHASCNNLAGARKGNRIAAARGNAVAALVPGIPGRTATNTWTPRRW